MRSLPRKAMTTIDLLFCAVLLCAVQTQLPYGDQSGGRDRGPHILFLFSCISRTICIKSYFVSLSTLSSIFASCAAVKLLNTGLLKEEAFFNSSRKRQGLLHLGKAVK